MDRSVRRVVTKQSDTGDALVLSDDVVAVKDWPGADAGAAVVWSTSSVPADNSDRGLTGAEGNAGVTHEGGSVFRVIDLGPGFKSPMHRTLTTDYIVVVSGELELILDGGDKLALFPGDTIVQRGTNHAWRNPSRVSRCAYVVCMIESQPVRIGGKTLSATPGWSRVDSALRGVFDRLKRPQESEAPPYRARAGYVRRIVTGHNTAGKAIVSSTSEISREPWPATKGALEAAIWSSTMVPANNFDGDQRSARSPLDGTFKIGSAFRIADLGPGFTSPEYRSGSIDYCFVLSGRLEVVLGQGRSVTLGPGDTLVQRGTTHAWHNPSFAERCTFAMSSIESPSIGVPLAPATA
jgi:mannose-6-phosphate isomerase-like protein (cupin superfamily)